jgi:hypothetical protein
MAPAAARHALAVANVEELAGGAVRQLQLQRSTVERHGQIRERRDSRHEHGDVVECAPVRFKRKRHAEERCSASEQDAPGSEENRLHGKA